MDLSAWFMCVARYDCIGDTVGLAANIYGSSLSYVIESQCDSTVQN